MAPAVDDMRLGALSYVDLRRWIGRIAFALPASMIGYGLLSEKSWPGSISAYYYTDMRNVFVGALCALAVFLFSYRYQKADNYLSTAAAVLVLGVAWFPTATEGPTSSGEDVVRGIHLACAFLFFVILAIFSLRIFTKSHGRYTRRKRQRNRLYRICGWTIVTALVGAVANAAAERWIDRYPLQDGNALFWLETTMVWAFGVSWLVKGGFWLADEPKP
jgi:hypothetical protein